ncbi:MAG: hypothetical protein ACFCVK_07395 [Acidimicrobiales bacterium]
MNGIGEQIFWFATRGAGIMSLFAAIASVLVGLLMSSRFLGRRPTIPWLLDLHRHLSAMALVFLAVHLVTLWLDSYVNFTWLDLIVPGRAEAPGLTRLSLAWGVVAGWLLVLVQATSLIRSHLAPRLWHGVHLTSFAVVTLGVVHGLQAGTDADNHVLLAVSASVLAAVILVALVRLWRHLVLRQVRYELTVEDEIQYDDHGYDDHEPDDDEPDGHGPDDHGFFYDDRRDDGFHYDGHDRGHDDRADDNDPGYDDRGHGGGNRRRRLETPLRPPPPRHRR